MKSKIVLLIIISMFFISTASGQEFPRIKKATIKSRVLYSLQQKLFFYKYTIKNDISSTGGISTFNLDVSLVKEKVIDTVGLKFQNELLRNIFRRIYSLHKGKVLPVGVSQVPEDWDGGTSLRTFGLSLFGPEILPGNTLDSIEINCVGLPSIRKVTFKIAEDTVIDQLPGLEDTTSTMTEAQRDSILASLAYTTWTVGPNVYADDISFVGILDSIKSYTERSAALKWIVDKKEDAKEKDDKKKDSKIVKELMKYLDKAREQLVKNKTKEAKKKLEEFVEKVEEDYHENDKDGEKEKRGYLTSEAYALLKYNAEYLIEQLK